MPTPAPDDAAEVRRALTLLRRSARLPLAFGGAVAGGSELRMSELVGTATNSLRGLLVARGRGLGGRAITARRVVAVDDYYASDSISHDFDHAVRAEGVRSAVAVPVIVRRSVRAVLYGAVREAVTFGDASIDLMVEAARDLEQELAVRDEVERRLASMVPPAAARNGTRPDNAPSLAPRELDVLAGVAAGQTNAEIAATLAIGAETVKSYLRSAMCKLDCHTRIQAVNAARRAGLLP
ncbi:helix-turn-helix transcriptional regulator [Amycolatopsis anabasis]|uniref:helix-turn-helix transcriptional regulator n=1 Tax=Amycolatopsis anabasis TaxID=1840409 RepID=UPI00131CF8DD|nr:LuxR C-terminal-related transcriptional regulator [Amycolatopsis anabasis]